MIALASLLLAATGAAPAIASDWTARYTVNFVTDEAGAHRADVEAELKWTAGRASAPGEVELTMAGGYDGGYGAFVRDFAGATPASARPQAGEADVQVLDAGEGRYLVPVRRDGRAAFRYSVPLEHDPAAGPGWDETPHALADSVLWTGRALFVAPADASYTLVLVPPAGQHVSTSLAPAPKVEDGHLVPDTRALRETYLLVGSHVERTVRAKGATMLLAVDGDAAPAVDVIEDCVQRFVATATAAVGGPPPTRCLLVITTCTSGEGGGSVYGNDAHVLVAAPPEAAGPDGWRRTLCHELFHLWNPTMVGFDSREMWYSEGFTEYYSHRLLVECGLLSHAAFRETVAGWMGAVLAEEPGVGLRQAGELGAKNNTLIYQGGALAALLLDVTIRDATKGKRTLDDVMEELYEFCGKADRRQIEIGELERLLGRHGGRTGRDFLTRHVAGAEPLPLTEVLESIGVGFERATIRIPERNALVPLLECTGMTVVPAGIRIDRTSSAALRADDVLVEVAGRAVGDFGDVCHALGEAGPGDEVPIVVLRDGARKERELRLGGMGADLPRREVQVVRLPFAPRPSRSARAIRTSLFGTQDE